jgi:hypothetical protein
MRCSTLLRCLALVLGLVASGATPVLALSHGAEHAELAEHHHDAPPPASETDLSEQDIEFHWHATCADSVIRRGPAVDAVVSAVSSTPAGEADAEGRSAAFPQRQRVPHRSTDSPPSAPRAPPREA